MSNRNNFNKRRSAKSIINALEKSMDYNQLQKDVTRLMKKVNNYNDKLTGVHKDYGTAKFYPQKTTFSKELGLIKSHEDFKSTISKLNRINVPKALEFTTYHGVPVTNYELNRYLGEKKKENAIRKERRDKSNSISKYNSPVKIHIDNIEQIRSAYQGWEKSHSQKHREFINEIYGENYKYRIAQLGNENLTNIVNSISNADIYDLVAGDNFLDIDFIYNTEKIQQGGADIDPYVERLLDTWTNISQGNVIELEEIDDYDYDDDLDY